MGWLGKERGMVRLRFRSLISMYRIGYFTESVLASSRTKDPEPISLNRTGPPGVLGIWGERLFIFMELGSTGNYFKGI